jgi:hypothetical protein
MHYTRIQIAAFARPTRLKDRMMCEPPGLQQFRMYERELLACCCWSSAV